MREYHVGQTVEITDGENTAVCKVFSIQEESGVPYVGVRPVDGSGPDITVTAPTLYAMEQRAKSRAALAALEERAAPSAPAPPMPAPAQEAPVAAPVVPAAATGDGEFPTNVQAAITAWRKAQTEAITARLRADEIRAQALLAVSGGEIEGVKATNAEARKAYADLQSVGSEGTALRAEAKAQAMRFWVETLTGSFKR